MPVKGDTAFRFWPYGNLDRDDHPYALGVDPPVDWRSLSAETPAEHCVRWRNALLEDFRKVLWPEWSGYQWVGDAKDTMLALTLADFELFPALQAAHHERIASRAPNDLRHANLFRKEDLEIGQATLAAYLPGLASEVDAFGAIWLSGVDRKVSNTSMFMKSRLQRPRPYQVALALGRPYFRHSMAKSASTPAMTSGHCLQGLVGTTTFHAALMGSSRPLAAGESVALEQVAVDIGDRRVFAGVHYPSDNIASWVAAIRMAPHVFGEAAPEARRFMGRAIARSAVFAAIRQAAVPGHAYERPFALLRDALATAA